MLIGKYQRPLPGFDDKVISLYTRGMSTREIQGHLEEIYGAEVSPQLISTITDAETAEVAEWQSRPLEPLSPVMFFDALRVKVRDQGTVSNKAVYLALGITPDGRKHILGEWGRKYAAIAPLWRRQWDQVIPFFAFPPEVRRIIYTTNAIESLNSTLRSAVRSRGHFPTDEAAVKLLYLVLRNVAKDWKNAQREWTAAMTQFAIMFADRFSTE